MNKCGVNLNFLREPYYSESGKIDDLIRIDVLSYIR